MDNFDIWKVKTEVKTGFKCYEDSTNNQLMFYGISTKFTDFKNYITSTHRKLPTGTIIFLMDAGESYMYYAGTEGKDYTVLKEDTMSADLDTGETYDSTYTTPETAETYEKIQMKYTANGTVDIYEGETLKYSDSTGDGTEKTFELTYATDTTFKVTVTGPAEAFTITFSGVDVNSGTFYNI